jgi:ATP-binding cassette, subfamily B, bacterial
LSNPSAGRSFRNVAILRAAGEAAKLQWEASPALSLLPAALSIAAGLMPALAAAAMRKLVDALASHYTSGRETLLLVAYLVAAGALAQVLAQISTLAAGTLKQRLILLTAKQLFTRVTSFTGLRRIEDPAFCDQVLLAEQAAQSAPSTLTSAVPQILQAGIVILSFVGIVYLTWAPMVPLLLAAAIPLLIAQHRRARDYSTISKNLAGSTRLVLTHRALMTDPSAAKEMHLFGFGGYIVDRYLGLLAHTGRTTLRLDRRNAITQLGLFVASGLVMGIGLWFVTRGVRQRTYTLGDLTLFIAAVSGIQGAVSGIILRLGDVERTLKLFPNYISVVESPDDLAAGSGSAETFARLELRDVWFRYDEHDPWVLRGLDCSIRAGEFVGLVGSNGAGKSTLIKLLCRMYDPQQGALLWNGVDFRDLNPVSLRAQLSAVFQDHRTYDLTVAENIGLGAVEEMRNLGRIESAARAAGLSEDLAELQRGYSTFLNRSFSIEGGQGATLSGGQSQRLALARALMRSNAGLVILDEANAGLDAAAEERLLGIVATRCDDRRATLFVSHRLGALVGAHNILVLDGGQIVAHGGHNELIDERGIYARLFAQQAAQLDGVRSPLTPTTV